MNTFGPLLTCSQGTTFGPPSTLFSGEHFWTSLYLFPDDYFWNLTLLCSQGNTFGLTSTSHRALELVAVVAVVLAVALRNTYCCFLYSSPVRNICSSAWNSLTTSPYKRKTISLNIAWVFYSHPYIKLELCTLIEIQKKQLYLFFNFIMQK